jgi:hypothetical protein
MPVPLHRGTGLTEGSNAGPVPDTVHSNRFLSKHFGCLLLNIIVTVLHAYVLQLSKS